MQHINRDLIVGIPQQTAIEQPLEVRRKPGRFDFGVFIDPTLFLLALSGIWISLTDPFSMLAARMTPEMITVLPVHLPRLSAAGVHWMGGLFVATVCTLLLVLRARRRLLNNSSNWETNCPCCGENELQRLHRKLLHRLASFVFVLPLRRYVCQSCTWAGVRIDHGRN